MMQGRNSMNWMSMDSSVFTSAAYDCAKHVLHLKFHGGDVYCYLEFPPDHYDEFLAAESKGEYFAHNIRGKFRYERVRDPSLHATLTYSSGR
jgi:hypothetical protein